MSTVHCDLLNIFITIYSTGVVSAIVYWV